MSRLSELPNLIHLRKLNDEAIKLYEKHGSLTHPEMLAISQKMDYVVLKIIKGDGWKNDIPHK